MLNQHKTNRDNIAKYNKPNPLVDYLVPFIGDKKQIKILDVGSGPYSVIGSFFDGTDLQITHADNKNFSEFWKNYNAYPVIRIDNQNMESLFYGSNLFDIVCCINALDHTPNAYQAVKEMIRVCRVDGYVYIDCHLDQMNTGHKHKWNAKQDGVLTDGNTSFDLKELGFNIQFINNGGESRYNKIVATLQKK